MNTRSSAVRVNTGLLAAPPRWLFLALFTVSGFSGLIYESIWSHYLKLFLGHAAYAQSLVLMIFMGGMAAGAWFTARFATRVSMPILAYALVEGVIGLIALAFHPAFLWTTHVLYQTVLPAVGDPAVASALKWSASAVLILPQSVLLGMTFPLMSSGIIRRYPDAPGGTLAMLYFTNSIGAAVGVLVSGFWLISVVGLPGTIFTAGLLNIALALTVWIALKLDPETGSLRVTTSSATTSAASAGATLLLAAAFVTGAASFVYEIGWIRMLSLVLGSTTHSFELMLSAFITGLAFGGLWIKRRIDGIAESIRYAGFVQVLMGVLAVLTVPLYAQSFDWMAAVMEGLSRTDRGFAFFNLASHAIALAIMLPATFMAGMTLPLFTHALMKSGGGESSIGKVYAANTVGGIAGVLFAVHLGLPLLGLKDLIIFAAGLDVALGLVLLGSCATAANRSRGLLAGAVMGLCAIVVVALGTGLDPLKLASGVYRTGNAALSHDARVLYYADGKTASVSLTSYQNGTVSLATNGKPDASLQMRPGAPVTIDEITMLMLGSMPLAYKPDAHLVGNIGFGSGLTSHTLLASEAITTLDTVEIEPAMVAAARGFGDRVARAFNDPRSHIHFDDAKSFFSTRNVRYDAIVAEPSNPWVSGVASLFSEEFYASMRNYLADDGVFVQWLQLYEFNDELALSVLGALSRQFSDFAIYYTTDQDVVIVARKNGTLGAPDFTRILSGKLGGELRRVGLRSSNDLAARYAGDRRMVQALFRANPVPVNSDFFPYVDLRSAAARFKRDEPHLMRLGGIGPLPVLEMLNGVRVQPDDITPEESFTRLRRIAAAMNLYDELVSGATPRYEAAAPAPLYAAANTVKLIGQGCTIAKNETGWLLGWAELAEATLPFLDPPRAVALINWSYRPQCAAGASPAVAKYMALYGAVAQRDAAAMTAAALEILDDDSSLDERGYSYALAAATLGHLASGHAEQALILWQRFGREHYAGRRIPAHLEFLRSLAVGASLVPALPRSTLTPG